MHQPSAIHKFLFPIILLPFLLLLFHYLSSERARIPPSPPPAEAPSDPSPTTTTTPAVPQSVAVSPPPSPVPLSDQQSVIEQALLASRQRRDKARDSYQRSLTAVDAKLLQQFGGEEWARIRALQMDADAAEQSELAIERWTEAATLLSRLRGELPSRQQVHDLRTLQADHRHRDFLQALITARDKHPQLALDSFWADINGWESERWMELAREEVQLMAADDPGFAEILLAVADYHASRGDDDAARQSGEQAWTRAARMTDPNRAAESGRLALQRLWPSLPETRRKELHSQCVQLASQASNVTLRIELLADLAAQLRSLGDAAGAKLLLDQAITDVQNSRVNLGTYWPNILRCRTLSRSESPQALFEICVTIPKYNGSRGFDPFPANTMSYAYAAQAAIHAGSPSEATRGLLLAEAQQLDITGPNEDNCHARSILAQTDCLQQNWRRALISAFNLEDWNRRAPLVFQVMQAAPHEVPEELAWRTMQARPTQHGACLAVAHYLPTLKNEADWLTERIPTILSGKATSFRAAAFIGLARRASKSTLTVPSATRSSRPEPQLHEVRSLLETAEWDVHLLQMPLERAWASLWIALCWQRLDQPASYHRACQQVHDHLFVAWQGYWRGEQPANSRDPAGEYRSSQNRTKELARIIECYLSFAEAQAFLLKDAPGALATCMDAARASELQYQAKYDPKVRLKLVFQAVHRECGLPTGLLDTALFHSNHFIPLLEAASVGDITTVEQRLQLIEKDGAGYDFKKEDCLARGYAELAILTARSGNLPAYQAARRKALGQIQSHGASESILLPIHEADAYAGEFSLAMNLKRDRGPLPLYGGTSRPQAALCIELSVARRSDEALKHLPPLSQPYWRIQAMHAIAAARRQHEPEADHLAWLATLPEPIDRIAALCGLALNRPRL